MTRSPMLPSSTELSELLGVLYEAAAEPAQWNSFLEHLAMRTRATSAALLIHDFEHAKFSLSSSWGVSSESNRLYREHYYQLDVWAQRAVAKPVGYVCNSQSLCPLREMRAKEIYNDFMVESGIEHGMFGLLENSESCLASVSLYRDRSRSEFTESNLSILQFLTPHLRRAFRLHFQLSELKGHSAGLEAALDMLSTGVIFFGVRGEIVLMNRSASALIAERDGLLATRDGLRAEKREESDLLKSAVIGAVSTALGHGVAAGGTVCVSRRTGAPVQVRISPIRLTPISVSRPIAAVAFVTDPSRRERSAPDILRAMFGLTAAECRVASLLGDGHAPRRIADLIGVSDNTVRSQVKSIFAKTGVKRQSELVRLLLTSSGWLRLPTSPEAPNAAKAPGVATI